MKKQNRGFSQIRHSIRNHVITGFVILIPVGVTLFILKIIFEFTAGLLAPMVRVLAGELPPLFINIISLLILMLILYLAGWATTNLLGRSLFNWFESLMVRVPLVNTLYSNSKQMVDTLKLTKKANVEAVVFIEFPREGFYSIGFMTGTVTDQQGKEYVKLLVPTSPNPTTGFLQIVPKSSVVPANLTVEEAAKMIISGGFISADTLTLQSNEDLVSQKSHYSASSGSCDSTGDALGTSLTGDAD